MKIHHCQYVRRRLSEFLDCALPSEEAASIRAHVNQCMPCSARMESLRRAGEGVRALPRLHVPVSLTTSLRVIASHERIRQLRWRNARTFVGALREDLNLFFNNLMKPFALPVGGGLMTATLVFSMFASAYPMATPPGSRDVPITLYTEATFKGMPLEFPSDEVMLDLTIDEQGRVIDCQMAQASLTVTPAMRRTIQSLMLYTEFNPATAFGKPVSGKVRVSFFRRGFVEVRG